MREENAIEVDRIVKHFKVYYDKGNSLKERVLFRKRKRHETHWVLKGVSFQVKKGEALGIIGKNGCGKSTILKILTRIMYPTSGKVEMKGRVSSLIELGAGFHPDMTGRENIYTNASIFGLNRKEIEKRIEKIIAFSELEEFIDNPVRTYSSGMYMRLAFAVAINVDADILLIDEILAVGDVSFQEKCFEKLKDIKAAGTTIVLVSHVLAQLEKICDRAIWIEDGLIREEGTPKDVGVHYTKVMEEARLQKLEEKFRKELEQEEITKKEENQNAEGSSMEGNLPVWKEGCARKGTGEIYFTDAKVCDGKGMPSLFLDVNDKMIVRFSYRAEREGIPMNFVINIARDDGMYLYGTGALSNHEGVKLFSQREGQAEFCIKHFNLLSGRYLVDIGLQTEDAETVYDYISNALEFRIKPSNFMEGGLLHFERCWVVDDIKICNDSGEDTPSGEQQEGNQENV